MITASVMHLDDGDEPLGQHGTASAYLYLDKRHGGVVLAGSVTTATGAYLRRLATEADKLADSVDAAVAKRNEQPKTCPRCDSPSSNLHPAVQHEGEVSICPHPWHNDPLTAHIRAEVSP